MKGKLKVYCNGELEGEYFNLIVESGIAQVVKLLNGATSTSFHYMAVGSSNSPPAVTQTELVSQIAIAETTNAIGTTDYSGDTAVFTASFSFSTTNSVSEVGLFTASSGGIMLNRSVIGTVNVNSATDVTIAWQIIV
ncbi:MAG: hypothetical protein QXL94_01760 [Candidatus Parvarchaeum sp.]